MLQITTNYLIGEITYFFMAFKLIDESENLSDFRESIRKQLNNIDFVESLIKTIIIKTERRKNIDLKRIMNLRLELEKVRINLEFKERGYQSVYN